MMNALCTAWRRGWSGLLLWLALCWLALPAQALDPNDLLPPEKAFRVEALLDGHTVRLQLHIADGYYLYRSKLALSSAPAGLLPAPAWPAGQRKHDPFFGETEIYRGMVSVTLPRNSTWPAQATLLLKLQGCADAGSCYPPEQRQLTPGARPVSWWQQGSAPASPAEGGALNQLSLPALLASFFVAGLGMALTACLYPMLPIVSAIVAGQGSQLTRAKGFWLSLAYVQGLAASYVLVGVAAGLTGSLLTVWLQQPAVILSASALMVVFALGMFDLIPIQLPSGLQSRLTQASGRLSGGRVLSVFAMGALSALIVGPCVAPPLAVALGYIGASGDAWLGGVALYALAMGLGAPLLLVGTLGGQVLPRAGVWMNRVKAGFGVVMLALAVYLAAPFLPGWLPLLLWAAIALGCALALWRLQRWPARLLAGAASTLAVLWLIGAATGAYQPLRPLAALGGQPAHRAFPPFTRIADSAELDTRLAQSRQPVLLDFYADWCVACKEMEADTFPDPAVSTQLQRFTRLQADVTANRAEHQALLKRFGLYGPPGILILAPDGRELQRVVGFVPPAEFARLLADVRLP